MNRVFLPVSLWKSVDVHGLLEWEATVLPGGPRPEKFLYVLKKHRKFYNTNSSFYDIFQDQPFKTQEGKILLTF